MGLEIEQKTVIISKKAELARILMRDCVGFLMPGKTEGKNRLGRTEDLLKEGYGLVVLFNHFSLRDPFQILKDIIINNPLMREKEIIFPITEHQYKKYKLLFKPLSGLLKMKLYPIANPGTLKVLALKNNPEKYSKTVSRQRLLLIEYMNSAVEVLKKGGIVPMAPQGERKNSLEMPQDSEKTKKPIAATATLIANLNKNGIEKVAFLIIGVGIENITDYGAKVKGLNPRKRYTLKIGPTYTKQELLELAQNNLRAIDQGVFEVLAAVVPPSYNKLKPEF